MIAESFGRIFYRNAINLGLPALICPDISRLLNEGSTIEINLTEGLLIDIDSGMEIKIQKIPSYVEGILNKGGLIPYIQSLIQTK